MMTEEFINVTEQMAAFLTQVKEEFDAFDRQHPLKEDRISFIEKNKGDIFRLLDKLFGDAWAIAASLDKKSYREHQHFYQEKLLSLFVFPAEINRYIYAKPLGYAGDFISMNYIFAYHKGNYLGDTSYEMLINNYTCNIPFSCSNIKRKDFFKRKITETMRRKENPRVLSVGCGSARELIELLEENKIVSPLAFTCLDFEKKALEYIKNTIANMAPLSKQQLSLHFSEHDVLNLADNKRLTESSEKYDFVYASGLFDYLRTHTAASLFSLLFTLLNENGLLIVCNASLENSSHRACYEMLGEWNMVYRTEEQMQTWTKGCDGEVSVVFEKPEGCPSYLFLTLHKNG